jgi:hypothetical protein
MNLMTAILASAKPELWKLTDNRFRILILSGLSFIVMC